MVRAEGLGASGRVFVDVNPSPAAFRCAAPSTPSSSSCPTLLLPGSPSCTPPSSPTSSPRPRTRSATTAIAASVASPSTTLDLPMVRVIVDGLHGSLSEASILDFEPTCGLVLVFHEEPAEITSAAAAAFVSGL